MPHQIDVILNAGASIIVTGHYLEMKRLQEVFGGELTGSGIKTLRVTRNDFGHKGGYEDLWMAAENGTIRKAMGYCG